MSVIDLGQEAIIQVKWRGVEYTLREPTVEEVQLLQKKTETDSGAAAIDLLSVIGMPVEVVKAMPISKLNMLVEGVLGAISAKK